MACDLLKQSNVYSCRHYRKVFLEIHRDETRTRILTSELIHNFGNNSWQNNCTHVEFSLHDLWVCLVEVQCIFYVYRACYLIESCRIVTALCLRFFGQPCWISQGKGRYYRKARHLSIPDILCKSSHSPSLSGWSRFPDWKPFNSSQFV